MKKLALAMGLIAASSSLNAATIYQKDGFKFKVDGDIQIQLRKRAQDGEKTHVDFDDSELKNKISYDLGNGLTGFAETHFDTGKNVNGNVTAEETFVGLKTDNFKVQLGRMDYVTDNFATEISVEGAVSANAFDDGEVSGSDVILFEAGSGPFNFSLSHDFGDSTRNTALSSTDVYITAELASNFTVGVATQSLKEASGSPSTTTNGINAVLALGDIEIAADYSSRDEKHSDVALQDLKVTNVSVAFPVANTTTVGVGFTSQSNNFSNDSSSANYAADGWYTNVTYAFPKAKKVTVFGEIHDNNADNASLGFVAGMRVKF